MDDLVEAYDVVETCRWRCEKTQVPYHYDCDDGDWIGYEKFLHKRLIYKI